MKSGTDARPGAPHGPACVAALLLLAAGMLMAGPARAGDPEAHGYFKNVLMAIDGPVYGGPAAPADFPAEGWSAGTFRLSLGWQAASWLRTDWAYALAPSVASGGGLSQGNLLPALSATGYRIADLDPRLVPAPGEAGGSFQLQQNLDRALVTLSVSSLDVFVGRQAIAFGSAHVINPTDVLAPFTVESIDTEERLGIDAVRARWTTGPMSELDVGWVAGQDADWSRSAAFVKQRVYGWETNLTVLLLAFRENVLLGLDMTRSLGGASIWLEAAATWAGALRDRRPAEDFVRVSAGADYNLADGLYGYAEYHYNGAGRLHALDYAEVLQNPAAAASGVYLLGEHYLAPGLSYPMSALWTFSAQMLINLADPSVFLSGTLQFSAADNVSLILGSFVPVGERSTWSFSGTAPGGVATDIRSEFGLYPTVFYTSMAMYF